MSNNKMNVAILGGSFDPPHLGHRRIKEEVLKQCPFINSIWMMPTNSTYNQKDLVGYPHRIKMCELATAHMDYVRVADDEMRYRCTSTWSLMSSLKNDPAYKNINFYYIIGMDCMVRLNEWINWKLLVKMVPFIVVPRAGLRITMAAAEWAFNPDNIYLKEQYGSETSLIPNISSTKIRNAFRAGHTSTLGVWLAPEVIAYCTNYKLYPKETPKNVST